MIDLRSDTVTQPSPAMREAMAQAVVGDDVYGEDPTVNKLEVMAAQLLGKEAALFVPTGVMANQLSVRLHTRSGDEVIVESSSHLIRYEGGSASALSQVQLSCVSGERGLLSLEPVQTAVRPQDVHNPPTTLLCLEQTHNAGGGTVYPLESIITLTSWAKEQGLACHLDGARLFNAVVASGISAAEYAQHFDTVSFCLSKGLGCPTGSILAGDSETIDKARRVRKILGGAMRQAGIIAAPGIVALESMIDRLAEDHSNARTLALGLSKIPGFDVDANDVYTNLVFVNTTDELPSGVPQKLAEQGVMVGDRGNNLWRLVTHNDVSSEDIDYTLSVIEATVKAMRN